MCPSAESYFADRGRGGFGTLQRAAQQVQGSFDRSRTTQARDEVLRHLIDEQLFYHQHRAVQSARANMRRGKLAGWSFFAVLAIVVLEIVLKFFDTEYDPILLLGSRRRSCRRYPPPLSE
jgi:hypothetical protein